MHQHQKLSKSDERELLRALAERRQQSTPQRQDAVWVAQFWRRLSS